MNLHDFEYFKALGDLLSFTAVASHFGVSQPTVTYAVKRLEQEFNCDLIFKDKSHRTVTLTTEGKILKAHAEHILDEITLTERAIEHSKKQQVHVGFPPIIRAKILSQLLNKKEAIRFLSNFDLVSAGSEQLLNQLLEGQIDFSLIGSIQPLTHPSLAVHRLYTREFYIFASKDNPLAKKKGFLLRRPWNFLLFCWTKALSTPRPFKISTKNTSAKLMFC